MKKNIFKKNLINKCTANIKWQKLIFAPALVALSLIISSENAHAYDITLICEGNGKCDMLPAPNTKLFDYSNMLPGDSVANKLTIQNTDKKNACDITVRITEDTEIPDYFADNLWTVIKEGAVDFFGARDGEIKAANYKNIQDVYNLQTINLGPLAANSTRIFDWAVTFNPRSENDLQNALTKFDLKFNLACKIAKKKGKDCIKFSKHHNKCGHKDKRGSGKCAKGDHIKFTMEIRSDSKHYKGVKVTDVPLHGHKYIAGSWTAHSNKHGDLKRGKRVKEPRYGSPGVWELGDMEPGEIITLTYEAEVVDEVYTENGTDLAWVSATDPEDASLVFSNDEDESLLTSSFFETDKVVQPAVPPTTTTEHQKGWFFTVAQLVLSYFWNFVNGLIHHSFSRF